MTKGPTKKRPSYKRTFSKNPAFYGEVGWKLRAAREACGLTQTEVAERLSVPQSQISKVERGKTAISLCLFAEWCMLTNADASTVLKWSMRA